MTGSPGTGGAQRIAVPNYAPPGPVAATFFRDHASLVKLIMGPFGSGKSTACVFCILMSMLRQRPGPDGVARSRWGVVRNTYPELRTTTIATWQQWVPSEIGESREQGPPMHAFDLNLGKRKARLEVLFVALDRPQDIGKLLSLELTGAWINEAREVPYEIFSGIRGRIQRYPAMKDGGGEHGQLLLDTNPPDSDHYLYEAFEEDRDPDFRIYKQPSGRSPRAENLKNLPKNYYQNLMKGQKPDFIRVYVDGEYGYTADGLPVYGDEYADGVHCAAETLEPVRGLPLIIGLDAGLTPAATFFQRMPNGQWRGLHEIVTTKHGSVGPTRFAEALTQAIAERFPGFDPDQIQAFADPASQYGADDAGGDQSWMVTVAKKAKLRIRAAPSNGLSVRLEAVREPMRRWIDGYTPGLIISPTMKKLRKGFISGYRYRRIQTSGGRYTDQPEKNDYSHVHDSAQYALLGGAGYAEITGRARAMESGRAEVLQTVGGLEPAEW